MNVLYVSYQNEFLGGAERSLYEILKNLDREKVTPFFASPCDGELAAAIKALDIPFIRLSPVSLRQPLSLFPVTLQLIRFIRNHRIDLIHNNQCMDAYSTWLAGKLTRTPVLIHHRDSRYYRFDRWLMNHVDCNICISTWQNNQFLNGRGIVVHNGIEIERFPKEPPPVQSGQVVEVGIVGRIAPIKGQETFIRAAQIVLEKTRAVHFKIIGDIDTPHYSDYKARLRAMVKENALEEHVEFSGYIPNVVDAVSPLDISVCASQREPFGRVAIESMACFKPVVATAVGGFFDTVVEETGILVPVDDPVALAEAILRLSADPNLRLRMGLAGRRRVEQHFTIQHTLSKLYSIYENLLNQRD